MLTVDHECPSCGAQETWDLSNLTGQCPSCGKVTTLKQEKVMFGVEMYG